MQKKILDAYADKSRCIYSEAVDTVSSHCFVNAVSMFVEYICINSFHYCNIQNEQQYINKQTKQVILYIGTISL